jgi:hypothetical protein
MTDVKLIDLRNLNVRHSESANALFGRFVDLGYYFLKGIDEIVG